MLRLPIVRSFSRIFNRAVITALLVLLQAAWLLWTFLSFTYGKVGVNIAFNLLSMAIMLYLVRKDENSAYKIVWIALMGLFPLLGGALYLSFGNKRPSKRMRQRMSKVEQAHRADLAAPEGQKLELCACNEGISRYVQNYGPYPAWDNTSTEYFASGEEMYPKLLEDLNKAQRFIFIEFFIVKPGIMWNNVEEILKRKAAQGVEVRFIYDDFGTLLYVPRNFLIDMERSHIRCIPFNPAVPLVSLVMNHRDHRKIVVVDGNVAYTGGINLADEYINVDSPYGYWKDAGLRVEGAGVWNFTVMFLNFWNAFRPTETEYARFKPTKLAESDGYVQPYADSPLDDEPLGETVYLNILAQSQKYVYIYTPYLAIGEEMMDALKTAAKRGVDVRLVLPGIPDKKMVYRLTRSYYVPLLRAGVRIFEYTPGFLHAKCYASDDRVATVGSINMDYRSLFLHFECGALLMEGSQITVLRDDMLKTMSQSREVQLSDCRTGIFGTLLDSVLRLFSPLM